MVWRLRAPARGGFYSFGQMALRSARARGRAGFFFELVLALVARGMFFFRLNREKTGEYIDKAFDDDEDML